MADLRQTVEQVSKRVAHARARSTVDLPLPIYEGNYVGRFRVLDQDRIRELQNVEDDDTAAGAAEFIADACKVICVRQPNGKVEPLTDAGHPVRFDETFAEAVNLEPPNGKASHDSAADVVLACWSLEPEEDGSPPVLNENALQSFGVRLIDWMEDTNRRVVGELAGKSPNGLTSETPAAPPQPA